MKQLFIHVGMGKTGTTSIQASLKNSENSGDLANQSAKYFGLGFPNLATTGEFLISSSDSLLSILNSKTEDKVRAAHSFSELMNDRAKNHNERLFIISNEALTSKAKHAKPLIDSLIAADIHVQIILFFRSPDHWLPSAYAQWGLKHKTYRGAIKSFSEMAPKLIAAYDDAVTWTREFDDLVTVKFIDEGDDSTEVFYDLLGLKRPSVFERMLQTPSKEELFLRAYFNDLFDAPVLPRIFDQYFPSISASPKNSQPKIENLFDYSDLSKYLELTYENVQVLSSAAGIELGPIKNFPEKHFDKTSMLIALVEKLALIAIENRKQIFELQRKLDAK